MSTPDWLRRHLTMPCVIYTRVSAGTDEYGNVMYADGPSVDGYCFLQPAGQEEIQNGRAEVGQYLVHFDTTILGLIDGFARVEVDGISYEAAGPPAVYPSLTLPSAHHVEIAVQRSTA